MKLNDNHLQHPDFSPLYHLPSLTTLLLAKNQLNQLPSGLSVLTNLTHLDLCHNTITDLYPLLEDYPPNLSTLLLRGNPLSNLPLRLHTLKTLQTFEFDPISGLGGIPDTVLQLPAPDLFVFLQSIEEKSIQWSSAKLILVGEENVGKVIYLYI